jgi:hypothetical protein
MEAPPVGEVVFAAEHGGRREEAAIDAADEAALGETPDGMVEGTALVPFPADEPTVPPACRAAIPLSKMDET